MKKKTLLFALGMSLAVTTVPCYGYGKMVDGVVAEISEETDDVVTETAEETEAAQKNGRNAGKMTIKEMVDIPERYVTNVMYNDNIFISADASVEIPDVEEIHLKQVKPANHDIDYYLNLVNCLADEPLQREDVNIFSGGNYAEGDFTINQVRYTFYLNLNMSSDDNCVSDVFAVNLADNYAVYENGIYDTEKEEYISEREELSGFQYLDQAEKFLERCGLNDFKAAVFRGETVDPSGIVVENRIEPEEKTDAVLIECEHISDQIPVNWVDLNYLPFYQREWTSNEAECQIWPPERLDCLFYNNLFASMEYSYAFEITGYSDENQFLLPFHEIRGIFEEMLGLKIIQPDSDYYVGYEIDEGGRRLVDWENIQGLSLDTMNVSVSKVRLGYMRVREEKITEEGPFHGILIPVWDFIGTWTAKYSEESGTIREIELPETTLLTLDARDGSVITRMFGY